MSPNSANGAPFDPVNPEAPVPVLLDFREIAQTHLPCGAKVPVFLSQYRSQANPENDTVCRDLLLGLDGIELDKVEDLAHLLAEWGVFLVPVPLAPQHNDFAPTNEVSHRSWTMPDESAMKDRAMEVCRRQISGYVQLLSRQESWTRLPWVPEEGDGPLCERVLRCLNEVLCRE